MNATILEFLRRHWEKIAGFAAVLALCGLSFAAGRFGTAERVVYQEKVVEKVVEKEVQVEVEKVVEKVVYVDRTKTRIVREEVTSKAPDGTETTKKTETIGVDADVSNTAEKAEERIVYVDREKRVEVEKEVFIDKTTPMPDWRIAAMGGLNFPELPGLVQGEQFDVFKHTVFGLKVERRLVGPLSIGAWGLSSGAGGLSLSLEF